MVNKPFKFIIFTRIQNKNIWKLITKHQKK